MLEIRNMMPGDVAAVAQIEQEIFSQPWSEKGFLDAINLGDTVFLVAEQQGQIVGYIGMYFSMDEGEITNVAVSQIQRNRGVGGCLLDELRGLQDRKG